MSANQPDTICETHDRHRFWRISLLCDVKQLRKGLKKMKSDGDFFALNLQNPSFSVAN
jgi:hypothetical protein